MPTFATPGPVAVTVEVNDAEVRLAASDRADTVVLVEPVNKANRSDVEVADHTNVEFTSGHLLVTTNAAGDRHGAGQDRSIVVTIHLPADSSLVAHLAQAEVHANGPLGVCEVHLASAAVELDRVRALRAHIADGDVAVGHITGSAEIDAASAAVRIGEVGGTVRFESSTGRIRIGDASDDLDLSTVNGGVEIERADGNVTAKTVDGAIRVGRLTSGRADLMNSSGNIEIGISEGSAAWIDATSTKGAVRSALRAQENPDDFENTVKVHARTRSGDIVIRRAAAEPTA